MTTNVSCLVKVILLICALFSNVYKKLQEDFKIKIDDIKNRIDIDLNRLNGASEADAKESLVVTYYGLAWMILIQIMNII